MANIILIIIVLLTIVGLGYKWLNEFYPKCEMCDHRFHWKKKFPAGYFKYCPAYKKLMHEMGAKNLVDFHRNLH